MQEIKLNDNPWPKHMFSVINEPVDIKSNPHILIIIPSKDRNDLLFQCINSIMTHTHSKLSNVHIRIVDTGSNNKTKEEIDDYVQKHKKSRFFIGCDYQGYYNFAKNNNQAFDTFGKESDFVVFCNNDIKFLNDVLGHMIYTYENKSNAGTVGARLHFQDGKLQHLGAFCKMKNNIAGPGHFGFMKPITGAVLDNCQHVPANTCALLMMRSELFREIKFSEEYLECFEDVQLNLSVGMKGFINYCDIGAVAFHYESQSRNKNSKKQQNQNEDLMKLSKFIMNNNNNQFIKEVCFD